jgi:LDH2 family malate/lactate/ureidoglycolate dehydrogenase
VPPFPAYVPLPPDPPGKGIGHFFGAMRIDAFRKAEDFKQHMDHWIRRFRAAETVEGEDRVFIPGDPEREAEADRRKNGVPLHATVLSDLDEVGRKFGIKL